MVNPASCMLSDLWYTTYDKLPQPRSFGLCVSSPGLLTGVGCLGRKEAARMDPLQAGVTAARHGQRAEARTLLKQSLQSDLNNEPAWLWLSTVVETDAERLTCLERALTINPQNQNAHAELERLLVSDTVAQGRLAMYGLPPSGSPSDVPSMPVPDSATANRRPVRRLPPHLAPAEEETPPPGNEPPPYAPLSAAPPSQSGPLTALALTGCLSVTAVSGLLVLSALWLFGWPP